MTMNALRSTVGLVVTLSALLILFAFVTKNFIDSSGSDKRINTRITVSGMEDSARK